MSNAQAASSTADWEIQKELFVKNTTKGILFCEPDTDCFFRKMLSTSKSDERFQTTLFCQTFLHKCFSRKSLQWSNPPTPWSCLPYEKQALLVFIASDGSRQTHPVKISLDVVLDYVHLLEHVRDPVLHELLEQLAQSSDTDDLCLHHHSKRQSLFNTLEPFRQPLPDNEDEEEKRPVIVLIHHPWSEEIPDQVAAELISSWHNRDYTFVETKLKAKLEKLPLKDAIAFITKLWTDWGRMLIMSDETDQILTEFLTHYIYRSGGLSLDIFEVFKSDVWDIVVQTMYENDEEEVLYRFFKFFSMADYSIMNLSQTSFDILGRMFASIPKLRRKLPFSCIQRPNKLIIPWFVVERLFAKFTDLDRRNHLCRLRFLVPDKVMVAYPHLMHFLNQGQEPIGILTGIHLTYLHLCRTPTRSNSWSFFDLIMQGRFLPPYERYALSYDCINRQIWSLEEVTGSRSVLVQNNCAVHDHLPDLSVWQLVKESIRAMDDAMFLNDDDKKQEHFHIKVAFVSRFFRHFEEWQSIWALLSSEHVHVTWDIDPVQLKLRKALIMTAFGYFKDRGDFELWMLLTDFWKRLADEKSEELCEMLDEQHVHFSKLFERYTTIPGGMLCGILFKNGFLLRTLQSAIKISNVATWTAEQQTYFDNVLMNGLDGKGRWTKTAIQSNSYRNAKDQLLVRVFSSCAAEDSDEEDSDEEAAEKEEKEEDAADTAEEEEDAADSAEEEEEEDDLGLRHYLLQRSLFCHDDDEEEEEKEDMYD